jgi:uncharacterized membrane protein HdeD (DUF308 family)
MEPFASARSFVLGIFRGLAESVYKYPAWRWALFSGLIAFGLGVYLLTIWHEASRYFFGMVIGVDLLCDGAALVGFAVAIERLPEMQRKAA